MTQHSIVDDLKLLKKVHQKIFGHFEVIPIKEDRNFAGLYNIAAKAGKSEFLFFSCVDIRIFPDAFLNLEKAVIKSNQEYAVFELRRYPKEMCIRDRQHTGISQQLVRGIKPRKIAHFGQDHSDHTEAHSGDGGNRRMELGSSNAFGLVK